MKPLLVSALALCCAGCVMSTKPLAPPPAAIQEMRMFGITISTESGSFPREFSQARFAPRYVDLDRALYPYVYMTTTFTLYFSPDPEYASRSDFDSTVSQIGGFPESGGFPYEYSYSTEMDGEFIEIPGVADAATFFENGERPDGYLGEVTSECALQELIVFGDYCLNDIGFVLPVAATHVELWFREQPDAERRLVNRVALENLTAWRQYVKPLIDQNAGSE